MNIRKKSFKEWRQNVPVGRPVVARVWRLKGKGKSRQILGAFAGRVEKHDTQEKDQDVPSQRG